MVPWIERPILGIDLDAPAELRYARLPREAFAEGRRLFSAITREIPPNDRKLAALVNVRTGGRFQEEATAIAKQIDADWRDVLLANISYDLILARFGCSTVALPSPHGPVVARNMD